MVYNDDIVIWLINKECANVTDWAYLYLNLNSLDKASTAPGNDQFLDYMIFRKRDRKADRWKDMHTDIAG